MKSILIRIGAVILVFSIGTAIFLGLSYVGHRSQGPLQDLFQEIEYNVATIERDFIHQERTRRALSLLWFDPIRADTQALVSPPVLLLGAYDDQTAVTYEPIIVLEDSLQTHLPIIHFYAAWGSKPDQVFPFLRAQAIWDLGSIPMITWEPWLNDFDGATYPELAEMENPNVGGMGRVTDGYFDDYIDKWAAQAASFGHPLFLRFAHEMNDPYRYPWGPPNNTAEDFIAAWQHVQDRFDSAGADNVLWIWSPHPAYLPTTDYYPGETQVDWIGLTTLNYGTVASWSRWWSFDEIIGPAYEELALLNHPIMLTEFGSLATGGDRAEWFKEALAAVPHQYPKVKSLVFFHVRFDNTTSYKSLDWSFKTDSSVLRQVRTYLPNTPD